jgi:hypothetical protein
VQRADVRGRGHVHLHGHHDVLAPRLEWRLHRPVLGHGKVARAEVPLIFHRYASGYPHSAIRVGDEKLVKIWKTGALELYDLKADPGERTDLASRRPERVRVLHEQLMAYFKRMDAEVLHGYGKAKEEN